jgi:hypothetical protein
MITVDKPAKDLRDTERLCARSSRRKEEERSVWNVQLVTLDVFRPKIGFYDHPRVRSSKEGRKVYSFGTEGDLRQDRVERAPFLLDAMLPIVIK